LPLDPLAHDHSPPFTEIEFLMRGDSDANPPGEEEHALSLAFQDGQIVSANDEP
jgi:hypothetical protein